MTKEEFFRNCKTIRQMIDELTEVAKALPDGEDSCVLLGDYERNYLQGRTLEIGADDSLGCAFVSYEMHESMSDEIPWNDDCTKVEFDEGEN